MATNKRGMFGDFTEELTPAKPGPNLSNPNSVTLEDIIASHAQSAPKPVETVPESNPISVTAEPVKVISLPQETEETIKVVEEEKFQHNHKISHFIRVPLLEDRDKTRINYAIRESLHGDLTELARKSGVSINVIIEYVLEEYLYENKVFDISKELFLDCYRSVKFSVNGIDDNPKKELQLKIPTFYVNKILEVMVSLNEKHGLKMDKATLMDILLELKIRDAS